MAARRGAPDAVTRPTKASLPGAKLIKPITQGEHDGLCGVYAIINACRLVLAPRRELNKKELGELFRAAYRWLGDAGELETAVARSVAKSAWPRLARFLCKEISRLTDLPLTVHKLATAKDSRRRVLTSIEAAILNGEAPVLFMRGTYRHYSVVSGFTEQHLSLFDSYGYVRVRRASVLTKRQAATFHRFHAASVLSIGAQWRD